MSNSIPSKSSSYHHGDLRNALIRSGLEILASEGVQSLSLRNVARKAEVSQAAPYRHFKDKDALLAAIAEQGFIRLGECLEAVEEHYAEDARSLFFQSGLAYIKFAQTNPEYMRIMFRDRNPEAGVTFPALQEVADEAFGFLINVVEFCQHEGLARPGHPLTMAITAWATLHGLAILLIDNCISPEVFDGTDEKTLILDSLDMILRGWNPMTPGNTLPDLSTNTP